MTIQNAISNAASGDTVMVEDGTYTGPANVDIDSQGHNITLTSQNGAGTTIIDCGGTSTPIHRGFYLHSSEGRTRPAVSGQLEGQKDGNGNGSNSAGRRDDCIYSRQPSAHRCTSVRTCTVTLTTALLAGTLPVSAADYNEGTATLTECTFTTALPATATAGAFITPARLTLTSCTASSNSGDGNYSGGGHLLNCITSNNSGLSRR